MDKRMHCELLEDVLAEQWWPLQFREGNNAITAEEDILLILLDYCQVLKNGRTVYSLGSIWVNLLVFYELDTILRTGV